MTIHDIEVFYLGMLKVVGFGINNQYQTVGKVHKNISFTSVPDSFEPSAASQFSELMKSKFSEKQLTKLAKKSPEIQENAKILANTKLSGENILDNLYYSFSAKMNAEKVAQKVNELYELCGENLSEIKSF